MLPVYWWNKALCVDNTDDCYCATVGLDKVAEVQRKVLKDDESESELTLKCHVEGNPEPRVIWTRNKERYFTNSYTIQCVYFYIETQFHFLVAVIY